MLVAASSGIARKVQIPNGGGDREGPRAAEPNPAGTPPDPELVKGGAFSTLVPTVARTTAGVLLAGNLSV